MGKIIFMLYFVSCILFLSVCTAFADSELWFTDTYQFQMNQKVKLMFFSELRVKNSISDPYYLQAYIGPSFSVSNNLDLNLLYALNYSKPSGNWVPKNLFYLDVIYKNTFPWILFNNRARFEQDLNINSLKYRNQFLFKKDAWSVGEELFFNVKKGFSDEGRTSLSYSSKLSGNTDLSLGFILRRQKINALDDWIRTSIINVAVKCTY